MKEMMSLSIGANAKCEINAYRSNRDLCEALNDTPMDEKDNDPKEVSIHSDFHQLDATFPVYFGDDKTVVTCRSESPRSTTKKTYVQEDGSDLLKVTRESVGYSYDRLSGKGELQGQYRIYGTTQEYTINMATGTITELSPVEEKTSVVPDYTCVD